MLKLTTSGSTASIVLLVLAAGLLGTVGIASALWDGIQPTPPLTITLLRLGFSAPFLGALAWPAARAGSFRIPARRWPLLAALGLAIALSQSLFFLAIPLAGVTLVVVISLCSAPVLVALLSIPLFGERLNLRVGLALILALVGTGVLVLGGDGSAGGPQANYLGGALLALGSGAGYSAFMLLSKVAARANGLASGPLTALTFVLATLVLVPFAVASGTLRLDLPPAVWVLAVYMGLGPTALAYFLIQVALRSASATTASIIILLEAAVAAVLAWLLLGERFGWLTLAGMGLLVFSVWLISRRRQAAP